MVYKMVYKLVDHSFYSCVQLTLFSHTPLTKPAIFQQPCHDPLSHQRLLTYWPLLSTAYNQHVDLSEFDACLLRIFIDNRATQIRLREEQRNAYTRVFAPVPSGDPHRSTLRSDPDPIHIPPIPIRTINLLISMLFSRMQGYRACCCVSQANAQLSHTSLGLKFKARAQLSGLRWKGCCWKTRNNDVTLKFWNSNSKCASNPRVHTYRSSRWWR